MRTHAEQAQIPNSVDLKRRCRNRRNESLAQMWAHARGSAARCCGRNSAHRKLFVGTFTNQPTRRRAVGEDGLGAIMRLKLAAGREGSCRKKRLGVVPPETPLRICWRPQRGG